MKLAAGLEYDGADFFGWQTQPHARNVQDEVQRAISVVADHDVRIVCAGRTDAGVHATGQVVHFESESTRRIRSWILGINSNLPADIAVTWLQEVDADFHARFSALSRSYRYVLHESWPRPVISRQRATWVRKALDLQAMRESASCLHGEHDFSSFRAVDCQAKSAVRTIEEITVTRCNKYVYVDVTANAFLHHMVRNIVGTLLEVGLHDQPVEWVARVLEKRNRAYAGVTAPAHGLYLFAVKYPETFALPPTPDPPVFG